MRSISCFIGRIPEKTTKGCRARAICALAMLLLSLASFGGVRTVSAALNSSGGFTVTLGAASGTTNLVFAAYGATSGGDTPSGWDNVDFVGVVPMEETTIDFAAPSDWESSAHAIRFFAIDGDGDGVPVEYVSGEDANVSFPLNYTPTSDTRIQIKFMYTHANGSTFVGTQYGTAEDADWRFFRGGDNTTAYFDVGNARVTKTETITSATTIYNFELGNHYIKDLDTGTDIVRSESQVDLTDYASSIQLFAGGDYGRVYSLKIYEGETLALDLEPRRDLVSGKGVFRDSLTGTIYEATGTGATGFGVFSTEDYEFSSVIVDVLNDSPLYTDYAKRIHVAPSGATVAAGQSFADVPVLLRLSESIDGFFYSDLRVDGKDMFILDEEGNTLPYEIEVWNPSGESLVWVKVPHYTSDTRLTVYYGDAQGRRNAANDPRQTWSAYAGVWHLDEIGTGITLADASPNSYDGKTCAVSEGLYDGVFGNYTRCIDKRTQEGLGGLYFNGTKNIAHGGKLTLSVWAKRYQLNPCWDHLFYNKANAWDGGGFASEFYANNNEWGRINVIGSGASEKGVYVNHGFAEADTWYYITVTYDVNAAYYYNNGVRKGGGSIATAMWDNGKLFSLGVDNDLEGGSWDGAFDEFRVSVGAMSPERIELDYKLAQAGAMDMTVRANVATRPVFSSGSLISNGDGTFTVSAGLSAGTATSVKAVLSDGSELELASGGATAGWSVSGVTFSGVPANHSFIAKIHAVNSDGDDVWQTIDGTFYTGTIAVAKTADAREEDLSPGEFVFSRAEGAAATAYDLVVNYTVAGTAVVGTDYVALSETVTIPAGESSAEVSVQPIANILTDKDVTVVASVASGNYNTSASSATVTIVNVRSAVVANYSHALPLTVAEGKFTGGPLTDFPVLVRLTPTEGGFSYDDFKRTDYADLAFVDDAGNVLSYEIQKWDTTGTSLVWVKVPSFSATTTIYAFYGSGISGRTATSDVWTSFIGVWHMDETFNGADTVKDATSNALDGTTTENSSAVASGVLGGARMLANEAGNSSVGRILVPYNSVMCPDSGYQNVTASLWCKLNSAESWAYLIGRKAKDDWDTWALQFGGAADTTTMRLYRDGSARNDYDMGKKLNDGNWHRVTAVYNGSSRDLYIDGVHVVSGANAGDWIKKHTSRDLAIGGAVNDDCWGSFNGAMDEVRVAMKALSADWEAADYAQQTDAGFLAAGSVIDFESAPAVGSATLETVGGKQMIAVPLEGGSGRVYVILRDVFGNVTTNAVTDGVVSAGTYYYPVSSLPANLWFDVGTFAEGADGKRDSRIYSVRARSAKMQRIALRVNGYTGANAVENFPALVRLSNGVGGFNYARLSDEGATAGDIHFQDASGNELPFDVDTWDPEGESLFWVKMPSLSRGAKIFLVYGEEYEPESTADALRAAVWSGQTGVWHMYFNSSGGDRYGNSAADNIDTMRGWNNNDVMQSSGIVGEARSISQGAKGATGGTAVVISNNDLLDLGNNFTVSVWLKYKNGQDPGWDRVISRKSSYNSADGWEITLASGSPSNIDVRGSNSKSGGEGFFSSPVNDGNWHYVTAVYSGEKVSLYENGVFRLEVEIESAADNNQDLSFGNNAAKNEVMFKGVLDEIRLGAGSLSADRIKADYETVADPEFFAASESIPGFMIIVR